MSRRQRAATLEKQGKRQRATASVGGLVRALATLLGLGRPRRWNHSRPTRGAQKPADDVSDPRVQMELISAVDFKATRLLNKSEYHVLLILEAVVDELASGLRVMAQPSMGEFISPVRKSATDAACNLAFRSINSKRVDFAVIDRFGIPILAVEYQGGGHYHRRSFMRDAVKREVLRKAKVHLIEVPSDYAATDLRDRIRSTLIPYCKN